MATATDAARDRVIAARADLEDELHALEAAGREAVDIPAKIRRSPAKVAAVAGGVGFLALKGPQRLFGAARRVVRGPAEPLPEAMLPDEIEKTLKALGSDGAKVRGSLERDFALYAKKAANDRRDTRTLLLLTVARPLLDRSARAAGEWLFRTDEVGFGERLAKVKARTEAQLAGRGGDAAPDEPGEDAQPPSEG